MHQTVELVLKSYMPKHLEIGMWFITKLNPGTRKEYTEVWALDKIPQEPLEEFIAKHGAPVEPYIIYDEQVLAEPHEIGWWDDGPNFEDLRDIELKDINFILEEWDGNIDIQIDEWDFAHEDEINPIIYADKITLTIPGMYDDEDEEDDDEDDNDDGWGTDDNDEDWGFDDMDDDSWKED